MRAVGFTINGGQFSVFARPIPQPGPGEVLIEVAYAGVNFAELQHWRGDFGPAETDGDIPGLEAAGRVVALGDGVTGFDEGQAVTAYLPNFGGYAEYVVAPAAFTYAAKDLRLDSAAAAPTVLTTAYGALVGSGHLQPGDTVLIHAAAGGVGTAAAQIARALGAGTIIGTVGSAAKVEFARSFGYDHIVVRNEFPGTVSDLLDGAGIDVVLDPVGGATRAASIDLLAPFGRLVAFGDAGNHPDLTLPVQPLWKNNRMVGGFNIGHLARHAPQLVTRFGQAGLDLLQTGAVRIDITGEVPLADAKLALDQLAAGVNRGKLVLRVR
ncbi:quinone oxidoreductase family protein [Actinoplanes palleronii]|uniref:NADPH:quinone reductase n=1 Tax=Actinoplanes palleronii TaxID=113570 RepID=A0ABQ4BRQ6_9ACTN|nr:zinc-binding alcohol dehydrogenase family protein [Actinoplanes palleronii]GIE73364.1 NADPH:quinone reductase [Actinoplanes palleronii]